MSTFVKSDYNNFLRDSSNNNLDEIDFEEESMEQAATAWVRERERIREARREEREAEQREKEAKSSLDNALDSANDYLMGQVLDRALPSYITAPAQVLELAQKNQLRVQSFLLGLPESPEATLDFIPAKPISYELFIPPAAFFPVQNISQWEELCQLINYGKTFTFEWNFTGWCDSVSFLNPGSGQTVQFNMLSAIGTQFDCITFRPAAWLASRVYGTQFVGLSRLQGLTQAIDTTTGLNYYSRYSINETVSANRNYASGFFRQSYFGRGILLQKQFFNQQVPGSNPPRYYNEDYYYVSINFRADITINATTANWFNSIPKAQMKLIQFFEAPLARDSWADEGGSIGTPVITAGNPLIEIPPEPISPPPPPPRKRCKCMSQCCPNNDNDLSDLKALIRLTLDRVNQIEKRLGTQVDVPLWDVDITKRGSNSGNRKPENLFSHLKLINERIEMALRVIGIHEVPLDVDQDASDYTGTIKMFKQSGNTELKKLGETLEKRQKLRVTHTSIMSYLDWVADTILARLGDFELTVKMPSNDMVDEKMRGQEIYYPDISTALTAILQWTIDSNLNTQYSTMMLSKALIESTSLKKMVAEVAFQVDATADYLGYEYKVEIEEMPTLITLEAGIEKLVELLAPGKVKVRKHILGDKQTPLEVQLLKLHEVTAITKAVHTVPTGFGGRNIASVVKTLLQASKGLLGDDGDSLEQYLDKLNKILGDDEDPLELEIAE